jgi:DNA-binding Lrp family transcriptional regulator
MFVWFMPVILSIREEWAVRIRTTYGQNGILTNVDDTDLMILRVLQTNARTSNRDVAKAVGVSPTTALERTRALHRRGVITGATVDVDLASIGRGVQALISIRIRPPSRRNIEGFRDWAERQSDTLALFTTSGTADFVLHLAVPSNDHLYAFVIDELTTRPEVADVHTSIVYEHHRNTRIAPAG